MKPKYAWVRNWSDTEWERVEVMAMVGNWAMVRFPRAIPHVRPIGELRFDDHAKDAEKGGA